MTEPLLNEIGKCPWCGGTASVTRRRHIWIMCDKCDASGPSVTEVSDAIGEWNRFAQPDPMLVMGKLRWEDGEVGVKRLYLGPWLIGRIIPIGDGPETSWLIGRDVKHCPTEAAARAALVEAVKEAIR